MRSYVVITNSEAIGKSFGLVENQLNSSLGSDATHKNQQNVVNNQTKKMYNSIWNEMFELKKNIVKLQKFFNRYKFFSYVNFLTMIIFQKFVQQKKTICHCDVNTLTHQ